MSRIGKKPIPLPKGVTVKVDADAVEVQGPKGKMRQKLPPGVAFEVNDGHLHAKTVREDVMATAALALMKEHKISALVVVDAQRRVTGALNMHDLLRAGLQ